MKKATSQRKSSRSRKAGSRQRAKDIAPKKNIRGGFNFTKKPVDQDFH